MKHLQKWLLAVCCLPLSVQAQTTDSTIQNIPTKKGACCEEVCNCARSLTPLGVATDHIHAKGEWMIGYSYMNMMMHGNQRGSSKVSDATIYESYMMAPENMTSQMHMLMAMYGATDRLTLMAMGGYATNYMSMNMSMMTMMPGMNMPMGDMSMTSRSAGLTDTRVSALYNFANTARNRIIGSLGIDLPTGTIRAKGTTMLGDNQQLPYDMQTGSGSFGIAPGITYVKSSTIFSYGAEAGATIRLNRNAQGYTDGNIYHAMAWAAYKLLPFASVSLRGEYVRTDKITGSDAAMDAGYYQASDPTTSTANYGGSWVSAYAGINFHVMKPVLDRFILQAEWGLPVYQNVNGTQMAVHGSLLAGLQYSL